jgi:hypothetical protein
MFQECSKSSPEAVASLYALGDVFVLTMMDPPILAPACPVTLSGWSGQG